jgi:two-component system chemotaxis response regulator CheB
MSTRSIRVLIADDSATMRYHLAQIMSAAPGLQVVGEARDGAEALKMVERLEPDVVSMDVRMPGMDGLEATRRIMAAQPTPIVVVTGLIEEDVDLAFRAMEAGALAVVEKPPARSAPDFDEKARQVVQTLTAMSGVAVVRRWERAPGRNGTGELLALTPRTIPEVVAVGASAGGPSALSTLLSGLPASMPAPVVIVQHLPEEFIPGLARWLDDVTPLRVKLAEDGDLLEPGAIYISPGGAHLEVVRRGISLAARLTRERGPYRYQPSVDVLMYSVAAACGPRAIGLILTGMGDDGAAGMLAMRQAGARTFAQDRIGCAVFGMPAAAIERGAAEKTLPLERMAPAILKLL